jgi:hypothetical protein
MKKKKVIKIWNGRGVGRKEHLFIGAYSKLDAARMLLECYVSYHDSVASWTRELTIYFSEGCWGNTMEGITPERGIWLQENEYTDHETLKRIYPIVK